MERSDLFGPMERNTLDREGTAVNESTEQDKSAAARSGIIKLLQFVHTMSHIRTHR